MADFATMLADAKVDKLHKTTLSGTGCQKYLCYSKVQESKMWMIAVTDGIDMWLLELDKDDLETQQDLNNSTTTDAFLTKIRNSFTSGDINVAHIGTKLNVTFGKGASTVSLDLYEARAAEKKVEFQSILFRLADSSSQLESQLASTKQQVETLKAQKTSSGGLSALMDIGPKKGQAQKPKQNNLGMSAINPTSRKRKAATGVVFGD